MAGEAACEELRVADEEDRPYRSFFGIGAVPGDAIIFSDMSITSDEHPAPAFALLDEILEHESIFEDLSSGHRLGHLWICVPTVAGLYIRFERR